MPFAKGKSGNPAGKNGKGELPTREAVQRLLWARLRECRRNPKACPLQLVHGCKVLLESLPAPVVEGVTIRNPASATPQAPIVPVQREPDLGDLLSS